MLETRSLAETSKDPSDYLIKRFEAIREFDKHVKEEDAYREPSTVRWLWSTDQRYSVYPYPKAHQACVILEEQLGSDDPIWNQRMFLGD